MSNITIIANASHEIDYAGIYLTALGYSISRETNIATALRSASHWSPCAYILDLEFLEKEEWKMLTSILRRKPGLTYPILIGFGYHFSRFDDREEALASGIDYYFVRPIDQATLATLHHVICKAI